LPHTKSHKKPKNTKQDQLSIPSANGIALVDVMIVGFIQSNDLPESLKDCPLLCVMIK